MELGRDVDLVGRVFGGLFSAMLSVVGGLPPFWSLAVISTLLGVVMLSCFKWIGDPEALERAKNRMQAHLMELRLFEREPGLVFGAIGRLFYWNARFVVATFKPAVVATAPMILLFVQMDHYYGMRPLRPGEDTVVTARVPELAPSSAVENLELRCDGDQVRVETASVRSWGRGLMSWRIVGQAAGRAELVLRGAGVEIAKTVQVGDAPSVVSRRRTREPSDLLLHPIEPPLAAGPVAWVEVSYPAAEIGVGGIAMHWLVWVLVFSVFGALIVRWVVNAWRPGAL